VTIGQLHPFVPAQVSPGIHGLAFDGSPGALLLDQNTWEVKRVSLADASVFDTQASVPVPTDNGVQLVFDHTSGDYYAIGYNQYLYRIDGDTLATEKIGNNIGGFFNFVGMGIDPAGNLWFAVDHNSTAKLWSLDKTTGVGTFQHNIPLPVNDQLTTMMIDDAGNFLIYVRNAILGSPGHIRLVDPNTGASSIVTAIAENGIGFLTAMDYDPLTKAYYGIHENRSVEPRVFTLVRITNVPEPSSVALAALAGSILLIARRRRSA